jgi:hypothetical protein
VTGESPGATNRCALAAGSHHFNSSTSQTHSGASPLPPRPESCTHRAGFVLQQPCPPVVLFLCARRALLARIRGARSLPAPTASTAPAWFTRLGKTRWLPQTEAACGLQSVHRRGLASAHHKHTAVRLPCRHALSHARAGLDSFCSSPAHQSSSSYVPGVLSQLCCCCMHLPVMPALRRPHVCAVPLYHAWLR